MHSLNKAPLRQDEEIYRILVTMVKKLKMSKKEEKIVYLEAVADLMWLNKILKSEPIKYSVVLNGEEVAKIIFYLKESDLIYVHDVYVSPRYRKQKLAKALLIEMLSDYRTVPKLSFHTRESNKPIHNLVQFFITAYNLPLKESTAKPVEHFYVDGGNAMIYTVTNPAYEMKEIMDDSAPVS